jgi:MATE family multidrug resistance protein
MEVVYFRIILYANVIAVFIWASSQFFMGIHRPIVMMYAALCAQVVNVVANYILIFGKFGFPAMGIAGAAWGTFLGIVVGATIRMTMFLNSDINIEFGSRRTLKFDFSKMVDLLKVGVFRQDLSLCLTWHCGERFCSGWLAGSARRRRRRRVLRFPARMSQLCLL